MHSVICAFRISARRSFGPIKSTNICFQSSLAPASATGSTQNDMRQKLTSRVKEAMKAKDTFTSTTIRSVLSEIYNADKSSSSSGKVPDANVVSIIRKAVIRRNESASQFTAAGRQDLAEKETREASLLSDFLPAQLSSEDVDRILKSIVTPEDIQNSDTSNRKKAFGSIMKKFYANVDRSTVDNEILKQRVDAILSQ